MSSLRHYLGAQHILSAAFFCRQALDLEGSAPDERGMLFTHHRAFVIGAVFCAVAFLEGTINQLFQDANDNELDHLKGLDARAIQAMAAMWGHGVPRRARYPVLEKFEIAFTLAGKPQLPVGSPAVDAAAALVTLRNALIHYEPEWIKSDSIGAPGYKPHSLEKRLRGRFAENALMNKGNPFYPDKALGHGCAEWAVNTALAYADAAHAALGLKPIYDAMRKDLATR